MIFEIAAILTRYSSGASIMEIAEEFFLSPETIKKIVYGKRVKLPEYSPSVYSAGQYSNAGLGEEWVRIYLESVGAEVPLIILFEDRGFHVISRRDYLSMLRKEKKNAHYAFIFAKKEEYEYYLKNFGKQFQR